MANHLTINRVSAQLIILLSGIMLGVNSYADENSAVQLLNKMHSALHQLQYQGNLVYIKDGQVSNLSVKHTIVNKKEVEVITAIDANSTNYRKETNQFSLNTIPKVTPALQKIYSFDLGKISKVAGRSCRVVVARPKDRKRYLQKYCIDIEYNVVLKYTLINQQHKTIEQFMFTQFNIFSNMQRSSNSLVKKLINKVKPQLGAVPVNSGQDISWGFSNLPTGFKLISNGIIKNDKFGRRSRQLIISDGMSSISVFISKGGNKKRAPVSSGALNIVCRTYSSYDIVLVGEVPKSTLDDVFRALKKKG